MTMKQGFFKLSHIDETQKLADHIAPFLKKGDCLLLRGDLGAGKTTFAQYLIRSLLKDGSADIPSPTFTLVQHYDIKAPQAQRLDHYDCYRLEGPEEILEIGLEDSLSKAITLIEWPEKIAPFLPSNAYRLDLIIDSNDNTSRRASLKAPSNWFDTIPLSYINA